ncbi:MAG: cytochrome P450 [Myxococcales bacterium]|nr:cytochrome P450 [Myxococcales bacterium]
MRQEVADWASDFDLADPEYNSRAFEIWESLRTRCPLAHSSRYGGMWLPLTFEMVRDIAYDTTRFTSRSAVVSNLPSEFPEPIGNAPPITSDPPFHSEARRLLLPAFAPKRVKKEEQGIRQLCRDTLGELGEIIPGETVVDVARQYAAVIPTRVISRMLGFPAADHALLLGFVRDALEAIDLPADEMAARRDRLDDYLDRQIEEHRRHPRDDLTSFIMGAQIFDQPLTPQHVRGSIALLLLAGIDTTWSVLGSSIAHLASHADDRNRLVTRPELMPAAVEEFLRAFAPVTAARIVKQGHDFHGSRLQEEEWVLLPFGAANRDPKAFHEAHHVVIDRKVNRHLAFGIGIHRCIGSHLARLELRVALEEFLASFSAFELVGSPAWSSGQIRGPRSLRIRILAS